MNSDGMVQHEILLAAIIIIIGGFAGYINAIRYKEADKDLIAKRYVLSGMGAAILVPLFLNMLSSSLIQLVPNYNPINYFIFAGFCFIAGYFSDRFIDTIGDKLMEELKETRQRVNDTQTQLNQTSQETKNNKAKINALIDNASEPDEEAPTASVSTSAAIVGTISPTASADSSTPDPTPAIINSFKGNYKFRTVTGIAKEVNSTPTEVQSTLTNLQQQGAAQTITKDDGRVLWSLTATGQSIGTATSTNAPA